MPVVCVVIQGGPGTLKTAYHAARNNQPVVVVKGSGMAADALAYAWSHLHGTSETAQLCTLAGLRDMAAALSSSKSTDDDLDVMVTQLLATVQDASRVVLFDGGNEGAETLDDAIFHAICAAKKDDLELQIHHAMIWERPDHARAAIDEFRDMLADGSKLTATLSRALVRALHANSPEFVELLLVAGARCGLLQPLRSLNGAISADDGKGLNTTTGPVPDVVKPIHLCARALDSLYEMHIKAKKSHVAALFYEFSNSSNGVSIDELLCVFNYYLFCSSSNRKITQSNSRETNYADGDKDLAITFTR